MYTYLLEKFGERNARIAIFFWYVVLFILAILFANLPFGDFRYGAL